MATAIIDKSIDEQTYPQQINGVAMSSAHIANNLSELIGDTDLVRINSLSEISGFEIFKCEHQNPGGSIKDRAALQLVMDAVGSR
ncbi:hypothetical protein O9993_00475 [Vibrio lentus]|nr:hypothetical protein [Vibrio lentus]